MMRQDVTFTLGITHRAKAAVQGKVTWNTLGAETRQAKAEDKVAPNIPAAIRGANPDTILMVLSEKNKSHYY